MEYNVDKSTKFYIETIEVAGTKLGETVGVWAAMDVIADAAMRAFASEQDELTYELRALANKLKALYKAKRDVYDKEYSQKRSDAWSILDNCIRKTDYPDVHEIK